MSLCVVGGGDVCGGGGMGVGVSVGVGECQKFWEFCNCQHSSPFRVRLQSGRSIFLQNIQTLLVSHIIA